MWRAILGRMREPSTWAGVAAIAQGVSGAMDGGAPEQVGVVIAAGVVAVLMREKWGAK
ncbi:MAG: hypothetical protein AB1592_18915 [Pseudomonadota bacterium]